VLLKEWMNIIQHPAGARRQFAIRENECVQDTDSDVIWYMSDTAQGSSGSPVFNDSFQVVALHHSGVARQNAQGLYVLKNKQTVKSLDNVTDAEVDWIANAGIRVSRICARVAVAPEKNGHLDELHAAMEGGDILSNAYKNPAQNRPAEANTMNPSITISQTSGTRLVLGTLVLELNTGAVSAAVAASPGTPAAPATATTTPAAGSAAATESYEPTVAPNIETRKGFLPGFLSVKTPLPTVTNKKILAPLKAGGTELKYEHFSIFMHKDRRLALFTASNVDGRPAAKKPEPGHTYTRQELDGFAKEGSEAWITEDRLDDQYQLPDVFYDKDNGAFDKGHIVRREDACWGKTFAEVQRANGDTFHVTNCSPQRGNFNQSGKHGIWGELENFIGAQASTEQYSIFAGPVLADDDVDYNGKDKQGPVKVKIPRRFWKVVCAVKDGKLQVFPFILEQDVKNLPEEFMPTAEWKSRMISLTALEKEIKLVKFPAVYHTADQAGK
jgi:endonuclease G, mitochondrial